MPYATRQGIIDFPKKKLLVEKRVGKIGPTVTLEKNTTPVSKPPISIGSSARRALYTSDAIVGREAEIKEITTFIKTHLNTHSSGSLYVSGLPGTGKTACVNHVIEHNEFNKNLQVIKINCTAFSSSRAVFKRICEELHLKNFGRNEKDAISCLEKYLPKKHKMILLILDEIDQLESKSQSVLYKIFEWPSWENSKFMLIGIANAMDLTEKNLPRLYAKIELKPVLLHFAPYSKDEITEILKTRLVNIGADKLFAPGAIELISAKVAGTSGDVRRALDLGRRVIEMVEQNQIPDAVHGNHDKSSLKENSSVVAKEAKNPSRRTPRKVELFLNDIIQSTKSPPKRKLNFSQASPQKTIAEITEAPSPVKLMKDDNSQRKCLRELEFNSPNKLTDREATRITRHTPIKLIKGVKTDNQNLEQNKTEKNESCTSNTEEESVEKSPKKLPFDVKSKDVLSVVKNAFGPQKNFKHNEESSFPLHQKLLICSLLLLLQKGKKRDCNVGKLHQIYTKVCSKRGLTSVDKSGFIFLCKQVELTGIIQLGKGHGTLAKVTLNWDETEVTNSLKDLNLLYSILNDVSCLT